MLYFDVECFHGYFLITMIDEAGAVTNHQLYSGAKGWNPSLIRKTFENNITVGFNSNSYDLIMVVAALTGRTNDELKKLSDHIIKSDKPGWMICKDMGLSIPDAWDHIDIIDVIPGQTRLKIYAARIGQPKLQDLPYHHDDVIETPAQREVIRQYCANDCRDTKALAHTIRDQLKLRKDMSEEYQMDLRSKSDAQIAEAVIRSRMEDRTGHRPKPTQLPSDYTFTYSDPKIIEFETPILRRVYHRIMGTRFGLSKAGSVANPEWLAKTKIPIGFSTYSMGIGGLHSIEKGQAVEPRENEVLMDFDVASYYPSIILQQGVYPKSLGPEFLTVFQAIVEERLAAKAEGDKVTADTLKIVVNGTYGKLGSKYSVMYSPDLLAQTTLTGQLALLMLIERIETRTGAKVVSANTDGIVVLAARKHEKAVLHITKEWQRETSYVLERNDYAALYSRDVNNYVAVKTDGSLKRKGVFKKPDLTKNPDYPIVTEAAAQWVSGQGNYYVDTIKTCRDIRQFVKVRTVNKGGAVWRGENLGKAVRYYRSTEVPEDEAIVYAKDGYKVPTSNGSRPIMELPDRFPTDIDYDWYIEETKKVINGMGVKL